MSAQTLNCPNCGAAAATDATRCQHCGSRLATVACPSCFGMMFLGAKFCSHCGARADRAEADGQSDHRCPRCRDLMKPVSVGNVTLLECPDCEGLWADRISLEQICADREKQAVVLGLPAPMADSASGAVEKVRYVPCPVCRKLMHRVNFARCSQVVVDVCSQHGTWFDRDELRRIVEFIRSGGVDAARAREIAALQAERRRADSAAIRAREGQPDPFRLTAEQRCTGLSAVASVLQTLFR